MMTLLTVITVSFGCGVLFSVLFHWASRAFDWLITEPDADEPMVDLDRIREDSDRMRQQLVQWRVEDAKRAYLQKRPTRAKGGTGK